MDKNKNFQVIRAIACMYICLHHFTYFCDLGYGAVGVEIFLILSGFLSVQNYYKKRKMEKRIDSKYLINKMIRILPLYYTLTICVFLVGIIKPSFFRTLEFTFINLIYSFPIFGIV